MIQVTLPPCLEDDGCLALYCPEMTVWPMVCPGTSRPLLLMFCDCYSEMLLLSALNLAVLQWLNR